MPDYVISLLYKCRGRGTDFVEYESRNATVRKAKQDAKTLAKEERARNNCSVRIVRVESRAASDRRRKRELGF